MADRAPIKREEKYCVAESRDNVTCTNTSNSPGIYMHKFSSDEVLCQKWTCQKASAKLQAIEVFGSLLSALLRRAISHRSRPSCPPVVQEDVL